MTRRHEVEYIDYRTTPSDYVLLDDILDELLDPSTEEEEDGLPDTAAEAISLFLERVEPHLRYLAPVEQDIVDLLIFRRKRQTDVAEILGVTQAAVSYRLSRAIAKLQFFCSVPVLTEEQIRTTLAPHHKALDVEILVGMWHTSWQSVVADSIGMTQGLVRHRLFSAIKKLQKQSETIPEILPLYVYFRELIARGKNTKHEVVLPQWKNRPALEKTRPVSTLEDHEIRRMRLEFQSGKSKDDLFREYNVSKNDLTKLLHGYVRKDAGGPLRERTKRTRKPRTKKTVSLDVIAK